MTMQNRGLARIRGGRTAKPYIEASSPEFLRILAAARRELGDATLGQDGKPRKLGRPRKEKR